MNRYILSLLLVGALCATALAETNYNVCFNSLDADYDGVMTKSEFMIAFPDGDTSAFETADADKNGDVSHEEWEAYKQSLGIEENHS